MRVSLDEAQDALSAIQQVTQRTRRSIGSSGAYIFLITTGAVWLLGFVATQFLSEQAAAAIWVSSSVIGSALAGVVGRRNDQRVRSPSASATVRRAVIFWLLLALFCVACIAVAQPTDGKQVTMFVVLFVLLGQAAMGLLLSFATTWWAAPIAALAVAGYFLFPAYFYLWMGLLVGGSMIALGVYIRVRW